MTDKVYFTSKEKAARMAAAFCNRAWRLLCIILKNPIIKGVIIVELRGVCLALGRAVFVR